MPPRYESRPGHEPNKDAHQQPGRYEVAPRLQMRGQDADITPPRGREAPGGVEYAKAPEKVNPLTLSERLTLGLLATGKTHKGTADALSTQNKRYTPSFVRSCVTSAKAKLGTENSFDTVVTAAVEGFIDPPPVVIDLEARLADLSPAELRVVQKLVDPAVGRSEESIGRALSYSRNSVKSFTNRAYDKLGINRRLQLAVTIAVAERTASEQGVDGPLTKVVKNQPEADTGPLTTQQKEALALKAEGKTNQEIADTLKTGINTIDSQITNAVNNLGASSPVDAVIKAIRSEIIDPYPQVEDLANKLRTLTTLEPRLVQLLISGNKLHSYDEIYAVLKTEIQFVKISRRTVTYWYEKILKKTGFANKTAFGIAIIAGEEAAKLRNVDGPLALAAKAAE